MDALVLLTQCEAGTTRRQILAFCQLPYSDHLWPVEHVYDGKCCLGAELFVFWNHYGGRAGGLLRGT